MTLREQLMRDEGFRSHPYKDTEGFLTIGFGRCLDTKGLTREEAEYLLDNDIAEAERDTYEALPWVKQLDEPRRAVILNMRVNMGLGNLLAFRKMLAAARAGDYRQSSMEMLDSKWYSQVGARAARLARQMADGEWT